MSLKKFGLVLFAILVLGAVAAASALAANEYNEEVGSAWYTGSSPGTRLAEGVANGKAVTAELASEKATLETTVAGKAVDITWTIWEYTGGLLFLSKKGTRWSATTAHVWTLKGLVETVPVGCSVPSEISTKSIKGTVGMKTGSSTVATVKFVPNEGTVLATVEITGKECAIAGTYKLTGTVFAEATNATGVFGSTQNLKFSKAIQESAGTGTSLKFGENAATITGTLKSSIGGTEFAMKEE
jgi:hypothetical protein